MGARADIGALELGARLAGPAFGDPKIILTAPRPLVSTIDEARRRAFFTVLVHPLEMNIVWRVLAAVMGRAALPEAETFDAAVTYEPPSVEVARDAGVLILVAEDNQTNQVVIRQILSRQGYAHEIAENGKVALEFYDAGRYGLLLSDFHMPEMDGFQLTRAIREREAARGGPRLPIIALTADALPGTERQCEDAGMDGYLTKPIDLASLMKQLERHLPGAANLRRVRNSEDRRRTGEPGRTDM